MKKYRFVIFAVLVLILLCTAAGNGFAQESPEMQKIRGDYLTVKVAVIGPGDELYFWWGHIGLIIEDAFTGNSKFYDYGLFSFENENFFLNFALGRLLYSCGASPVSANVNHYRKTNRDIFIYTLDLEPQKKEEVRAFAEKNILPENRDYYYHHFKDNCATRIRDIIDLGTAGQFKEAFGEAPGRFTLRQEVRRHTWFAPFFDWLLNFLMGQRIDQPITVWEEMFLPSEIGDNIRNFTYTDSSGRQRKLVSAEETLNLAVNRPAVLDAPRKQWPRELLFGCAISLVLVFILLLGRTKPVAGRVALGVSQSVIGLFFGIAGLVLFFMTFFTNHDYTYDNANLLYVNPFLLLAVPLGIRLARGKLTTFRFRTGSILKALWTVSFFCGILSMLIKLLPWFYQQNQVDQALYLPIALVLSFIPGWLGKLLPEKRTA